MESRPLSVEPCNLRLTAAKCLSHAQRITAAEPPCADVILGGQDGLVNMLGIALGVVSAGGSTHILIVSLSEHDL